MAFKFNMEQILKYRNSLETRAMEELAKRQKVMEEASEQLARMQKEEQDLHGTCRQQVEGEVDLAFLEQAYNYLDNLEGKIEQQAQEKEKTIEQVNEQRENLKECWQERRVMEILKDKAWEEYKEEEKKQERMNIDELTLNAYGRKIQGL